MIELIKHGTTIDFVGKIKYITSFSVLVMIVAIWGIVNKMNYGVDFRGGAEVQVKFSQKVELETIRNDLSSAGFKGVSVQTIGEEKDNEVLLKVQAEEGQLNEVTQKMSESLKTNLQGINVEIQKVDIVGPKAGNELRLSAIKAMLWAILAIMVYIAIRFDFRYAPGVIISLIHDVVVVSGIIAFSGFEFSLQMVAALLAIIGYSVNDTVIVYDRIREHEEMDKTLPLATHVNNAINDTLSRTILTSMATLLVSGMMFAMGGGAIKDFFFAMSAGIIFGTYSSVYVAGAATIAFDRFFAKDEKKKTNQTAHA